MNGLNLTLSQKQLDAITVFDDPQIVDSLFGGGAGGAKSLTICLWMLLQIKKYPGIRIGLGRKELTRLKQTTIFTLQYEAHKYLGIKPNEAFWYDQKGLMQYANGSSIQCVDLAWIPTDPNYDRFGSLNFTHTIAEEAGEIPKKARDVFFSRKNRHLNNEYNIVGKSISTCNPSQNYLKMDYYKPYKELGGGEMQKWPYGEVEVDGVKKEAYRAFIRSLASDNPFISPNYIEVLRRLPDAERKRLLEGNWDFEDTDLMLFKPMTIDRATTHEISAGDMYIGVDISDTGSDKTILTLMENKMFTEQIEIKIDKERPIGEQIALAIIKFAQQRGFTPADASRIAIDGIGVGASTRDFLKQKGWFVRLFMAGAASSTDGFKNLRGETIYGMSQDLDKGLLGVYAEIPTLEILREDLMAHEYTTEERTIVIKSKKDIKEVLGRSPDNAESAYIAYWASKEKSDPSHDQSRIML